MTWHLFTVALACAAAACSMTALYQSRREPELRSYSLACALLGSVALALAYMSWQEIIGSLVIILCTLVVVAGAIGAVCHEDVSVELRLWWKKRQDWRRFDRECKRLARSDRRETQR